MIEQDKQMVEELVNVAKQLLIRDKSLLTITFVKNRQGEWAGIPMTNIEKDLYASFINSLLTTGGFESYVTVTEAWISETIPPPGKKVSDMDSKTEAIIVNYKNDKGERICNLYPFERQGEKIVFKKTDKLDGEITGKFDFWR